MIENAVETRVDYIKFHTFITELSISKKATGQNQFEMVKKLELKFDDFRQLKITAETIIAKN